MAKQDFYDVLGVSRDADDQTLKQAFRNLAKQYHPDRNNGDDKAEQKFKQINEAYDALKNAQTRAAYDQYGHAAFDGSMGAGRGFGQDFGSSMSDIFDDLFGEFTGGHRNRGGFGRERGNDLRYNLEISLEDAYTGDTVEVRVPTSVSCETCEGSGAKAGTSPSRCQTCNGHGKVRAQQGFFTIERTCPNCQGRGEVISEPCSTCNGAGRTNKERTLSVNIPSGVEDGTRIRISGEGEAGMHGGASGDLYIFLDIQPHEFFQRDGADVFCSVPISMPTASLGGEIEVPTIDGSKARVKITEGAQTGSQYRLKAKGMTILRSKRTGDMYIQTTVETPRNLTKRQKELLREFEEISNEKTNPESAGFFSRVKELWGGLAE